MKFKSATHWTIGALAAGFMLVSCSSAQTKPLSSSELLQSGNGKVTVSADKNDNTAIELEVNHLVPADRVAPPNSQYVVWIEPFQGAPVNLGRLKVNDDLDAKFRAVTPFEQFELYVTAEPIATVEEPSGQPLLWTQVARGSS